MGPKPVNEDELAARVREARRLTLLLEASPSFSFARLGDMDAGLLLAFQDGVKSGEEIFGNTYQVNGARAAGCPGIGVKHADRLLHAFNGCDYLDHWERSWPNSALVPRLRLQRPDG